MKKVLIMLSTFNGEKFLDQQVTSLIQQKGVDVKVFVRDDGSSDRTKSILKSWANKEPERFVWVEGKQNLKPAKSYLELIRLVKSENADYYAFSDQDDVWHLDKLQKAVQQLNSINKPAIFMSTYNVVDENLVHLFKRNMHFYWKFTLETTIVYRVPSGCTMVFNQDLFNILKESNPKSIRMHDYWTLLTAEAVNAQIVTTDEALLEYRQHGDNSIGFNKHEGLKRSQRLFHSIVKNKNERQRQGVSVLTSYTDLLSVDKIKSLNKLATYNSNFSNRIALALDKSYKTNVPQKNLLFKIAVLMGAF